MAVPLLNPAIFQIFFFSLQHLHMYFSVVPAANFLQVACFTAVMGLPSGWFAFKAVKSLATVPVALLPSVQAVFAGGILPLSR